MPVGRPRFSKSAPAGPEDHSGRPDNPLADNAPKIRNLSAAATTRSRKPTRQCSGKSV